VGRKGIKNRDTSILEKKHVHPLTENSTTEGLLKTIKKGEGEGEGIWGEGVADGRNHKEGGEPNGERGGFRLGGKTEGWSGGGKAMKGPAAPPLFL